MVWLTYISYVVFYEELSSKSTSRESQHENIAIMAGQPADW